MAEQTLSDAEKKALLIVSDAKEKAKADRKSIIENAENAAEDFKQTRGKRRISFGQAPVTRLKARLIP